MLQAIGIVVLVLLFMVVVLVLNTRSNENSLMTGFWKADADFNEQAGVELFLIYMGESSTLSNKRPGYILVKNSDGLIINNPVEFQLSGGKSINPKLSACREYNVYIDWLEEAEYSFFPSDQDLHYYPESGKMVFSADDQVYAVLYKDNVVSDIMRKMPDTLSEKEESAPIEDIGESEKN